MINIGVLGTIGVAIILLFTAFQADRLVQRQKGAAAEVAKIEQRSNANAAKANAARRSADKLPDDGLRDRYTRAN